MCESADQLGHHPHDVLALSPVRLDLVQHGSDGVAFAPRLLTGDLFVLEIGDQVVHRRGAICPVAPVRIKLIEGIEDGPTDVAAFAFIPERPDERPKRAFSSCLAEGPCRGPSDEWVLLSQGAGQCIDCGLTADPTERISGDNADLGIVVVEGSGKGHHYKGVFHSPEGFRRCDLHRDVLVAEGRDQVANGTVTTDGSQRVDGSQPNPKVAVSDCGGKGFDGTFISGCAQLAGGPGAGLRVGAGQFLDAVFDGDATGAGGVWDGSEQGKEQQCRDAVQGVPAG